MPKFYPIIQEAVPEGGRHCVRAVASRGKPVSDAFAICVSAAQKSGKLEPGTMTQTDKGQAWSARHRSEKGSETKGTMSAKQKRQSYERLLKQARSSQDTVSEAIYPVRIHDPLPLSAPYRGSVGSVHAEERVLESALREVED